VELALVGRMLAACTVIGLVLAGVQYVARRSMRLRRETGGGRLVTLLETTYLPGAASVHVLRIADRYHVVGRSGGEIAPICEIPPERVAEVVARSQATAARSLSTIARRFIRHDG